MNMLRTTLLALASTVALCAQTTHFVGPTGLPQINDALAIAAPDDVIIVQPAFHLLGGKYDSITVTTGVVIRPLNPGPFSVIKVWAAICTIPAGQHLHLAGLEFGRVIVSTGRVTLDTCRIEGMTGPGLELLRVDDSSVHLQATTVGSSLSQPGNILAAYNSLITAADCTIEGLFVSAALPPAIILNASQLHASHCTIGVSSFGGSFNGPGIRAENGSKVWLSDSTVNPLLPNSCAIESVGSVVRADRCTLSQGTNPTCTTGSGGGFLLSVHRPQPLAIGQTFQLDFRTEPSGVVFVLAGPSLATIELPTLLEQPSWLASAGSFQAALLVADANGQATASWPIPSNPVFSNAQLWFEGIGSLTLPLQVSPPVGGLVR